MAEKIEWVSKIDEPYEMSYNIESPFQRLKRKCIASPLVPIGLAATTGALSYGIYNFYKQNSVKQQYCMRARVLFQGFTLAAIAYSMYYGGKKEINDNAES